MERGTAADGTSGQEAPSAAELVRALSEQSSALVRQEVRLAQLELEQKGKRAGVGAGLFGGAGALLFYGVAVLVAAAVLALARAVDDWLAAVIVAAVLLAAAGVSALVGKRQLQQAMPPVPEQTVDSVERDVEAIKQGAKR